jgi:two-component system, NtrC family, sensor kinase
MIFAFLWGIKGQITLKVISTLYAIIFWIAISGFIQETRAQSLQEVSTLIVRSEIDRALDMNRSLSMDESITSNEALRIDNQFAYINLLKGNIDTTYLILKRVEEAADIGASDEIRSETHYFLADLYYSLGQSGKAINYLRNCISYFRDRNPQSVFLHRAMSKMALINLLNGNVPAAQNMLELINDNGFDDTADPYPAFIDRFVRAELAVILGNFADASLLYQSALEWSEQYDIRLSKGYLLTRIGRFEESRNSSRSGLLFQEAESFLAKAAMPEKLMILNELSAYYTRSGNSPKALEFYDQKDKLQQNMLKMINSLNAFHLEELDQARTSELQFQLMNKLEDSKSRQVWIFLTILVALYLTGFVIVFRRLINQKNKSQQELAAKNIELVNKSTQITETQSRLIQSEKMAVLGRLSSGIAHELNTPIGAIKGNVELIHDLQTRELDQWFRVSSILKPEEFKVLVELMKEACERKVQTDSTEEERKLHKKVSKYFEEVEIPNKDDVIDIFADLLITEELHRYTSIYSHEHNVDILELALFVFNRSNSVETAKIALSRAEKILHSFRTYSFRRGWEDFKSVDIKENMEVVISLHQNTLSKIKVELHSDGDTQIIGVPDELSQVWSNIINNSIEAMKGKGKLFIDITADGENVRVDLKDTGGGIHLEDGQDVFDPFFSTKKGGGSGLGMDLTRQIVQKHDGTIKWKNTNDGVVFTVILPKSLQTADLGTTESIQI